jgi:hypothetical protein
VRTIGRCVKEQTEYTVSIVVISKVLFDYRQIFVNNAIMLNIIISPMGRADGPPCRKCGAKTRLFGTESHPLIGQLRVLSYVCVDCDAVRVDMAPLPRARGQLSLHREAAMPMAKLLSSRAFDPETTSLLGAAFDKAWQTVQTSGSPLADEKHAAATREILAKNILAAGHRGDRDIDQLVEEALALLIISNDTSARGTGAYDADASAVERHS